MLIDAEAVYAPEAAGEVAPGAPGIEQVALQVVLEHLGSAAVEGPESAVRADVDQVDVGGVIADLPFIKIFAVFVEDLNAVVAAVVDEDVFRLRVDGDAVDVIEIARTVGSSRVDLQACKLEYSIVSPK